MSYNPDELKRQLKELIITTLELDIQPEQIRDAEPLFGEGLGLDSIDALELALALKKKYGIKLNTQSRPQHSISLDTLAVSIAREAPINSAGN